MTPTTGTEPAPTAQPDGVPLLLAALAGQYDRWRWSPGLSPDVVGEALGVALTPGPARLMGRDLLGAVTSIPTQPYPVRWHWQLDGRLELVQLSQPPAVPSWPEVIDKLGDPTVVHPHGSGVFPGSEQRCYLSRGLTVFDGAGLGYQAVWLYPPMTQEAYAERTGAFTTPTRSR